MLLPIKWLKDYVDIDEDVRKIADEITLTGSHVESIIDRSENLSKIVVGKIEKIEKHPDADKLVVCSINIGDEIIQIVTGAKNVFEGAVVPVALSGSHIAGGVKIKKGKLRGVESNGMLCSLGELGLDVSVIPKESRDGIYIFKEEFPLGSSAIEALDLDKEIIELEITPNRPDCLSIIGMARETAATFNTKLKTKDIVVNNEVDDIKNYFDEVKLETKNCTRFYGRVIKDVTIKDSPQWLKNYLISAGVRPINNIVDLTNFVMLEYGQPLHAYDLDFLKTKKIVVRDGRDGENIVTLDNETREINSGDILITDGENIIGLGGIMGALNSEVVQETKTVFIEGANFDSDKIRSTSKRMGLRTEASSRFEKGISMNTPKLAVNRVCQLAEEIGAGVVIKGDFDNLDNEPTRKIIKLRTNKANSLIGFDLTTEELSNILNRLEIETEIDGDVIIATIPDFRLDLEIEEDLIEEIARIYGFHNIVPKPLEGSITVGGRSELRNLEERVKKVLLGFGFNEFMTYSFVSPSNFDKLNLEIDDKRREVVKLINPLGEEYSIMRTTLVSNMLEVLSKNEHRGNDSVLGFEFGNTFTKNETELPNENLKLAIGYYDVGDFYFLKEVIEKAFWTIGIIDLRYKRANETFLHPGRSAEIYINDDYIGVFGEVHPNVLNNFEIKKKSYVAEIDFEKLLKYSISNYLYKDLPKFPSMKRDLAIVVDRDFESYSIEEIARKHGLNLLEDFKVFDVYTGTNIGDNKKSIAFSMTFRASDRTLVDEEVNLITEKVLKELEEKFDAKLRA